VEVDVLEEVAVGLGEVDAEEEGDADDDVCRIEDLGGLKAMYAATIPLKTTITINAITTFEMPDLE